MITAFTTYVCTRTRKVHTGDASKFCISNPEWRDKPRRRGGLTFSLSMAAVRCLTYAITASWSYSYLCKIVMLGFSIYYCECRSVWLRFLDVLLWYINTYIIWMHLKELDHAVESLRWIKRDIDRLFNNCTLSAALREVSLNILRRITIIHC